MGLLDFKTLGVNSHASCCFSFEISGCCFPLIGTFVCFFMKFQDAHKATGSSLQGGLDPCDPLSKSCSSTVTLFIVKIDVRVLVMLCYKEGVKCFQKSILKFKQFNLPGPLGFLGSFLGPTEIFITHLAPLCACPITLVPISCLNL